MFRRSRGFTTTIFILCSIVMFGYGLYMYDLQSLKLTEAESKVRRLERSEHSQSSELKQLKNAKNELEEKLKKEKHEHQQKTLTLKLETEQRDARESDLREVGGKLNMVTAQKNACEEKLDEKDAEIQKLQQELSATEESSKTFEETAVACQKKEQEDLRLMSELKSDLQKYMELSKNSEAALGAEKSEMDSKMIELKEKNAENEGKYHQTYEELMELKEALHKLGIEGLRRDQNWVGKLTEDERSVILQGVLNTDLIQNELLLAEPTPEAPKAAEPAEVNEPPVEEAVPQGNNPDEKIEIEKSDSEDEKSPEDKNKEPEKIENIIIAPKVPDEKQEEGAAESQIDENIEKKDEV